MEWSIPWSKTLILYKQRIHDEKSKALLQSWLENRYKIVEGASQNKDVVLSLLS